MFDPLSNFKLNKILSAVNALPTTLASSFTEVKNAIAGVDEKVVYNGEGIDDLKANTLINAGSVVKSIQSGAYNIPQGSGGIKNISISNVNVDKSIAYVTAFCGIQSPSGVNTYGDYAFFTYSISENSLVLDCKRISGNCWLTWYVVEFY